MKCLIFNPQISYDTFFTFHSTGKPVTIIGITITSLKVRLAKFYYQMLILIILTKLTIRLLWHGFKIKYPRHI